MTTKPRKLAGLAALAVLSTALGVATAGASTAPVSVSVSGTQTVVDEAAGTFAMQGSLVGTWQFTKFVPHFQSDSQFVASGRETFTGCLDSNKSGACDPKEPSGGLKFKFIYWATFDPASGALIHGECIHPIVGGSGSFRKATGVIHMDDTPAGDTVVTTYKGTIVYDAKSNKSASTRSTRGMLSASSAGGQRATCGA